MAICFPHGSGPRSLDPPAFPRSRLPGAWEGPDLGAMRTAALLLAALLGLPGIAQWSTDPDAPTVLCAETGEQTALAVRPDGMGGWYAMWLDERVDPNRPELYGQHILADGTMAWEPNGRPLIADVLRKVKSYTFDFFANGDMGVLYVSSITGSADTVSFMRFNAEGNPLWAEPTHVGGHSTTNGNAYNAWRPMMVVQPDGSVLVSWMHAPQNSNGRMAFGKVGPGGGSEWGYNGLVFSSSGFGHSAIVSDGAGGLYATWSGSNAWGAPVLVQRILANGTIGWSGPISALNLSTDDNNNEFRVAQGADATLLVVGGVSGYDLTLTKVFPDGTAQYNELCVAGNAQRRPSLSLTADALFVTWQDNRDGSPSTSYVQKLALDGTPIWQSCGMPAITMNNYLPHPRVVGLPDGGALVTQQVTAMPQGMRAQRLDATGNTLWATPVRYTDQDLSAFYGAHTLHATADNGAASFWVTENEDLYMALITPDGWLGLNTTGIAEEDASPLSAYPVPTAQLVELRGPDLNATQAPTLFGPDGRRCSVPMHFSGQSWQLDLSELSSGLYLARVPHGPSARLARVVKQ